MTIKNILTIFSNNSAKTYQFLTLSFLFTALVLFAFVFGAGEPDTSSGLFYSLTIPVYYYLLLSGLTLLALPVFGVSKLTFLVLIPKSIIDILLVADYFVFGVYRFHIDMMFINMAIYDFAGIGVSAGLVVISIVSMAAIVGVNLAIYKNLHRLPKFSAKKAVSVAFVIFLAGQFGHVVGYEYKRNDITKYTPYLPYYAPLTSSSLMAKLKVKYPGVFPAKSEANDEDIAGILASKNSSGLLQYPLAPMRCKASVEKPNILLFVAESWRQGDMDAEITPHIHQFSQQAKHFDNHYSGGSVTVNGLFTLMYGLHPTYRDYMTASPYKNQALLTRLLAEQGYDVSVYTSSNLDRFSLKAMMFGKIADENYINPMKDSMEIDDKNAVDALLKDLAKPSDKPWFKFVFLSSSHHSYTYPDEFKKFTPIEKNPEAFLFNKQMDATGLLNDYKNSVHYIDHLFGRIWQGMEQAGVTDNTMTIVTSDHGEEFNDNKAGYWGHGNNFTKYQTAVPFYLKMPASTNQQVHESALTGHIDVAPTILKQVLNCENPVEQFSSGVDLLNLPEQKRGLIMSSYKDKAYLIDEHVYATGLSVSSYKLNNIKQKNNDFDFTGLNSLKKEERRFLK